MAQNETGKKVESSVLVDVVFVRGKFLRMISHFAVRIPLMDLSWRTRLESIILLLGIGPWTHSTGNLVFALRPFGEIYCYYPSLPSFGTAPHNTTIQKNFPSINMCDQAVGMHTSSHRRHTSACFSSSSFIHSSRRANEEEVVR